MAVTRIGDGVYRVVHNGRTDIVYVAGSQDDRWAFCDGRTFHVRSERQARGVKADGAQVLSAPMPATVLKVLAPPGTAVRKGDPVLILEAMKMELPLRAPADATVAAINCREGELVQPDVVLVELR
jgi:biotin carboxyl carrier protein